MGQKSWTWREETGSRLAGRAEVSQEKSMGPGTSLPLVNQGQPRQVGSWDTNGPPVNPEHVVQHFIEQDQRNVKFFFIEDFQPCFDIIS